MKRGAIYLFLILLILFGLYQAPQASNERNWTVDQKIMTTVRMVDDEVQLRNIRTFTYQSETEYERNYYDKILKVDDIVSVDFILSHFADWKGAAHAFLSFGFQGKEYIEYVAVSVEIRKEEGEEYSPFWGLFKQYELNYVVADERDVIRLRTNFREEPLYIFPIQVSKENIEALFLSMMERISRLETQPEFYNTLASSCMTNITDHVNGIAPETIPWNYKTVFPGYADEIAYELELVDTSISLEELRSQYLVNTKAKEYGDGERFSQMIRKGIREN
jgi:hypothetical protein